MKKFIILQFFAFGIMVFNYAQWPSDPTENLALSTATGEQAIPKVATSETGTTYVAWYSNSSGNYDVMLQKLDVYGNKLWAENGLLVSDNPAMTWLTDWDMTVDQTDCAILTFQDVRNGDNDVFAYRISPEGEFLWGEDGIEMSTGPAFDVSPKVCVTGTNNACFAWQADAVVIIQKISPEGNKLWGESGITLSSANTYSWPQMLAVGEDDVILKYFEDSGPVWAPTRHVFAQRFDGSGNPVWANNAIVSNAGGISAWTQIFPFISDGNDGFYIAWNDDRDFNNLASVFVQHVSSIGEILLGTNGTEASTMMGRQNFYPFLALPPGSEDIFVYWNEMDGDQNNRGIYGQKISATGERMWTDNGKSIIEISSTNVYPFSASQSQEDMIVFYEEYINAVDGKIKAMRLDTDGEFVWENEKIDLCSLPSGKIHPEAGNLYFDQWIAVWEDDRNGPKDIYGQNIQLNGTLGPVVIQGEFEIHPDSLVFEISEPLSLTLKNNTQDVITIEELFFTDLYCYFDEDPPDLPYDISPGDSLILSIMHSMIVDNPDDYLIEFLNIVTQVENYVVTIYVNEDLIGNVQSFHKSNLSIFPNPSNSVVKFEFNSQAINNGVLNISDETGKIIQCFKLDGKSSITWDGKNGNNQKVKPGPYFYQLISDEVVESGKIIMLE